MAVCEGSRCHFRLASAQTLRVPISFGRGYLHTLFLLSSCAAAALTSCQADRGSLPTQWQVSDGKALCLEKKDTKATLSALLLPAALLSVVPFCPSRRFEEAKKASSFFLSGTAVRRHIGVFLIEPFAAEDFVSERRRPSIWDPFC